MKDRDLVPVEHKVLLSVPEAAALLSVSPSFVHRQLIATGALPTIRVGTRRLVKRLDLETYVANQRATGPTAA